MGSDEKGEEEAMRSVHQVHCVVHLHGLRGGRLLQLW